ncbi:hypothetical protein ACHAWF_014379 [Thalassiosira exigua]
MRPRQRWLRRHGPECAEVAPSLLRLAEVGGAIDRDVGRRRLGSRGEGDFEADLARRPGGFVARDASTGFSSRRRTSTRNGDMSHLNPSTPASAVEVLRPRSAEAIVDGCATSGGEGGRSKAERSLPGGAGRRGDRVEDAPPAPPSRRGGAGVRCDRSRFAATNGCRMRRIPPCTKKHVIYYERSKEEGGVALISVSGELRDKMISETCQVVDRAAEEGSGSVGRTFLAPFVSEGPSRACFGPQYHRLVGMAFVLSQFATWAHFILTHGLPLAKAATIEKFVYPLELTTRWGQAGLDSYDDFLSATQSTVGAIGRHQNALLKCAVATLTPISIAALALGGHEANAILTVAQKRVLK